MTHFLKSLHSLECRDGVCSDSIGRHPKRQNSRRADDTRSLEWRDAVKDRVFETAFRTQVQHPMKMFQVFYVPLGAGAVFQWTTGVTRASRSSTSETRTLLSSQLHYYSD